MEVIVKREDLEIIRNERLKHYMNSDLTVAADEGCGCGCSCSSSASESSCC
jgi:hypothetical protein